MYNNKGVKLNLEQLIYYKLAYFPINKGGELE